MLKLITSGNARKEKGVAALPRRADRALTTADPAAGVLKTIPSQSPRNVTGDRSDEIDSAQQGGPAYVAQGAPSADP